MYFGKTAWLVSVDASADFGTDAGLPFLALAGDDE